MTQITKQNIATISRLSRIAVPAEEQEAVAKSLGKVIGWVESLSEVNVDGVAPLTNVHSMSMPLASDIISQSNDAQDVLKNSAKVKYNYFTVPKVIE